MPLTGEMNRAEVDQRLRRVFSCNEASSAKIEGSVGLDVEFRALSEDSEVVRLYLAALSWHYACSSFKWELRYEKVLCIDSLELCVRHLLNLVTERTNKWQKKPAEPLRSWNGKSSPSSTIYQIGARR
mmetsp:Transcript_6621/g.11651  ORF Transcript_6621/g.11651 Transcript_6621/m.11651 type:complete len:128 (+) Transcript_6621:1978-2361(+)